jgi:hypothetical protein
MRYVIAIAGESNKPRITQHVQDANRQHDPSKQRPAPGQLGLSRPAVIPLESSDAEHQYQLVLSFSTNQVKGGCREHSESRTSTDRLRRKRVSARFVVRGSVYRFRGRIAAFEIEPQTQNRKCAVRTCN